MTTIPDLWQVHDTCGGVTLVQWYPTLPQRVVKGNKRETQKADHVSLIWHWVNQNIKWPIVAMIVVSLYKGSPIHISCQNLNIIKFDQVVSRNFCYVSANQKEESFMAVIFLLI